LRRHPLFKTGGDWGSSSTDLRGSVSGHTGRGNLYVSSPRGGKMHRWTSLVGWALSVENWSIFADVFAAWEKLTVVEVQLLSSIPWQW